MQKKTVAGIWPDETSPFDERKEVTLVISSNSPYLFFG